MKKRKILIISVILLLIIGYKLAEYELKPENPVRNEERIWNAGDNLDRKSIDLEFIENVNFNNGKFRTYVNLDNDTFRKIIKSITTTAGNLSVQEMAIDLDGNKILVRYPYKVLWFNSQINVYIKPVKVVKNRISFEIVKGYVGKVRVSNRLITDIIADKSEKGAVRVNGNVLTVKAPLHNMSLDEIKVENGRATIGISFDSKDVINAGKSILEKIIG